MLNKNNERELAYVVRVTDVLPMDADRLECVCINGWRCVCGKNEFKKDDLAVFFEIDSLLPEVEPFISMEFLASKHYKIKSQKIRGVVSQGLLVHPRTFGWEEQADGSIWNPGAGDHGRYEEGTFLTQELGVTYYVKEDNHRKSSVDKYKKMAKHHAKLFSHFPFRQMMRTTWGKKLLFIFFGSTEDKHKKDWPAWVVKTDEERVQNMPWILTDKSEWIATEKIDGTSTTATVHKKKWGKGYDFYICSRNVVFNEPDKKCYYEENYYTKMAEKYHLKETLCVLAELWGCEWVTLQGETYGSGVQKRDYGLKEQNFAGFNLITSKRGRLNSLESKEIMERYDIPWVPIVDCAYVLPDTVEELLDYATDKSRIDGGMREGIVFRSQDGTKSFKAVSNEFLLKYHA